MHMSDKIVNSNLVSGACHLYQSYLVSAQKPDLERKIVLQM